MELKWRVLTILLSGLVSIYIVTLLQDTPYPHPITLETERTTDNHIQSTQVLLTKIDDYFYKTQLFFDATLKGNRGRLMGIRDIQLYVNGYITQSRKGINDTNWEDYFAHVLPGPITHSSSYKDRFAVLYHTVTEEESVDYYVRVYYNIEGETEYKDLHLPGNTEIRSFTLEEKTLLYSRDPDQYRFRVIQLPKDLFTKKNTKDDAKPIHLTSSQPGEPIIAHHQPKRTKNHVGILSQLYSNNDNIYRVFSLDIHQTKHHFYINATLVDGIKTEDKVQWIRRDHMNTTHDATPEYMTFTDGIHQRQITLPNTLMMASLTNKKTIVMPIIEDSFLTLDYTNNTERHLSNKGHHKYLYKDGKGFLPEMYFWMQDDIYDDPVLGMQLSEEGMVLAVWTESNAVYLYRRGGGGMDRSMGNVPHGLDRKLEWILKMRISPVEGQIGRDMPIGNALFWNSQDDGLYLSIILKNGIVNTYSMDNAMEQRGMHFRYLINEKWELWIGMICIVTFNILHEIRNFP
ncbi:hypothetical protein K501DRAFT_246522 [Backusella circina FSU 941]|nr:hypothetical protein K501DRAFT_246522 [Backusella circina FSU 941]